MLRIGISLLGVARLDSETLHGFAVDELDLVPGDHVALAIFTLAIAYFAALDWLIQFAAFRAFLGDLQLELTKQQGLGAVLGCESSGHNAVAFGDLHNRRARLCAGG